MIELPRPAGRDSICGDGPPRREAIRRKAVVGSSVAGCAASRLRARILAAIHDAAPRPTGRPRNPCRSSPRPCSSVGVERLPSKQRVAGSSPAGGAGIMAVQRPFLAIFWWAALSARTPDLPPYDTRAVSWMCHDGPPRWRPARRRQCRRPGTPTCGARETADGRWPLGGGETRAARSGGRAELRARREDSEHEAGRQAQEEGIRYRASSQARQHGPPERANSSKSLLWLPVTVHAVNATAKEPRSTHSGDFNQKTDRQDPPTLLLSDVSVVEHGEHQNQVPDHRYSNNPPEDPVPRHGHRRCHGLAT